MGLAMVDAHAGGSKQFAGCVQQLSDAESQLWGRPRTSLETGRAIALTIDAAP